MLVSTLTVAALAASLAPPVGQQGKLVTLERNGLKFELFLPRAWEPSSGHWPVLIFLHGRGESGGFSVTNAQSLPLQLLTNSSLIASLPFIVIVPQCPTSCMHVNHWTPHVLQSVTGLVREWVVPSAGGDPSRVYLAGQSMGGHGAWLYAAQQPRLFEAMVVVCGYAQGPREEQILAERLSRQKLPVAVYHSADDSVIPVMAADRMVHALRSHGGYDDSSGSSGSGGGSRPIPLHVVRYDHAPGPPMPEFEHLIGHGSYELAFRDDGLYKWLLQHTCAKCASRPAAPWHPLISAED